MNGGRWWHNQILTKEGEEVFDVSAVLGTQLWKQIWVSYIQTGYRRRRKYSVNDAEYINYVEYYFCFLVHSKLNKKRNRNTNPTTISTTYIRILLLLLLLL